MSETNEAATPKKKRGRPAGAKNKKTKKKKTRKKASEKTAERSSRLKPAERETIRKNLVEHFGASKIDKALTKAKRVQDLDPILLQFKKQMEQEIEDEEREVKEYYQEINKDYKSVGRPKSVFNWQELEYLCSIGCTLQEVAGFFQMAEGTIRDRIKEEYGFTFGEYYDRFSQGVKVSLRRAQVKKAIIDGDVSMQKFLGINMLGQKNKLDFEGEVKVNSWVDLVTNIEKGIEQEGCIQNEEE